MPDFEHGDLVFCPLLSKDPLYIYRSDTTNGMYLVDPSENLSSQCISENWFVIDGTKKLEGTLQIPYVFKATPSNFKILTDLGFNLSELAFTKHFLNPFKIGYIAFNYYTNELLMADEKLHPNDNITKVFYRFINKSEIEYTSAIQTLVIASYKALMIKGINYE